MKAPEATLVRLQEEIRRYYESQPTEPFVSGQTTIPLIVPSYGWEEVYEALACLLSTKVTMGEKVRAFEGEFARYIGVEHAVMVNSGSSANLIAFSMLTNPQLPGHLQPGDEVITPAVTWATTVFPIIQTGLRPVFVDVDLDTFNLRPEAVEASLGERTRAILLVHLLGNPCEMEPIVELARRHKLVLIEDCCEAHGAEVGQRRVGSFGDLATFSFYFSHHITTIEGGMVLTSNSQYAEMLRALRVFGWIRDLKNREQLAEQNKEIDPRFLFVNLGYNFRPTEIQGAFGLRQLPKLESFIEIRRQNATYWSDCLKEHANWLRVHRERPNTRHVWYGYPITVRKGAPFSRTELINFLERKNVESRPIMAGNIAEQPVMRYFPHRVAGDLRNSQLVMRNSFFIGNHQGIGPVEREAVVHYLSEFLSRFR